MNNEITIVTALFSINRDKWKGFERSNNKYIEYFKFWARIQNNMIIYTTSDYEAEVMQIRKNFDRENTKVVVIDDVYSIDIDLYQSILNVAKNQDSVNFRLHPEAPESWNANYNYITCLKTWFLQDAVSRFNVNGHLAWVDFGFNHGGELYTNSNDFDFKWQYNFNDKVNIFLKHPLDNSQTIFDICRRMDTYIQGSIMIASTHNWIKLWPIIREQMLSLNRVGLMDDDQTIMLMAYRNNPQMFETHLIERWHAMFIYFSNHRFEYNKNDIFTIKGLKKFKHIFQYKKLVLGYSIRWNKKLNKKDILG